jgi:hypothetical protein
MPHVTVNYEMFLPGGHHRQPRNTSIELNLAPTAGGDVPDSGIYTPPFFPQLPYTLNGGGGMANLLFWSVTDGANGQVLPPSSFNQTVGSSPLSITAWYFPISGPGTWGGTGSAIIDDAFSANLGRFIDDTFVDVTSDPTLTNDANVTGIVPTNVAETLVAKSPVPSTGEPFAQWILNDGLMPINSPTLNVPKGTNGIAIAIYQEPAHARLSGFDPNRYASWQWVDHGTMVDGGPHPWNPFVNQLIAGVALANASRGFDEQVRGDLVKVGLQQIKLAAAAIEKSIRTSTKM